MRKSGTTTKDVLNDNCQIIKNVVKITDLAEVTSSELSKLPQS